MYHSINLAEKLAKFHKRWVPRVIAEMNDNQHRTTPGSSDALSSRPVRVRRGDAGERSARRS